MRVIKNWFREILDALTNLVHLVRQIRDILHPKAKSATLDIVPSSDDASQWMLYEFLSAKGRKFMPATILVGGTATAVFKEWTGPDGTGTEVAPIATPTFASSDNSIATVDGNGLVTGVAVGSAAITGTDSGNGLTATDTVTVDGTAPGVAQSATLNVTAN